MEQLTLKEAANSYYSENKHVYSPQTIAAFEAGAEWQKEQSKELINLMRQLLAAYSFRYTDTKQLLVGYTNEEAFEKLNNLIEQLQD